MKKRSVEILDELGSWQSVEYYLAADVDAREAQSVAVISAQRQKIQELEIATQPLYFRRQLEARAAKLEEALRYWLPDEILVAPSHEKAWNEHIKLLSRTE